MSVAQVILLIAVLIGCVTAPINMVVDFLFQEIIFAPSADKSKVLASAPTGTVPPFSFAMTSTAGLAQILPVTRTPTFHSKTSTKSSKSMLERFTVPETATRLFPSSVGQSHASTSMLLKDVFETKESKSESQRSLLSVLRSTDSNEEEIGSSVYNTVERGGMSEGDAVASFHSFCVSLYKQSEHLSDQEKVEFQVRWGLNSSAYDDIDDMFGSVEHNIPSGYSNKVRKKMTCWKTKKSRKLVLSKAKGETSQLSCERIRKLTAASDMHTGIEIIHQFIVDLLG